MIRSDIRSLSAYHVQDSDGLIKLDAMENPFELPEEFRIHWAAHLSQTHVNRYPDASMLALREKIAARDGVSPEQILLGNGSDEIIQMLLLAADKGACLTPAPTFVMYDTVSRWLRRDTASVSLTADFDLNPDRFLKACTREKAAIVFLACPNNPTGNMWSFEAVKKIAEYFRGMVVIDEAYFPFASHDHLSLVGKNVLVLRTFSKMGFAGLRLGYLVGDADVIAHLNKVRMPYNINSLTQSTASFFLDHSALFDAQVSIIKDERTKVAKKLKSMKGVEVFASEANFLLFRVDDANTVFEQLLEKGILIKNMHSYHPLLRQCLRVTIGKVEENEAFIMAMKEILA
ncbi:MAG: histidinol-phosphate transaminase [Zetaproteobacteria bacterium CG2_30_46_52]|nr:MAG: histidinol-phosphate transaminase [Zetaproteobacteria bacterium CG2_30_46_52]